MTAKLQGRDAGTLEARRIVCTHIAKALAVLKGGRPADSAIHEARRSIKRARAVWRLLQPALPRASYHHANARLRDAGQPLSAARDAKILIVALDGLLKAADGAAAASAFRHGLVQDERAIKQAVMREPGGIALSRQALRRAYQYIKECSVGKRGWTVLGKGLQRVYGRGRRLYHRAQAQRRAEDLHEWRQQVKYLHHELAVLKPLWKGPIGKLAGEASELSERLGDDHDLAVLRTRVLGQQDEFASPAQQTRIVALIDHRRAELQDRAFMLGARIYEERPGDFCARFGGYWHEWRHSRNSAKRA
jgi:CHAD domain-containing protein